MEVLLSGCTLQELQKQLQEHWRAQQILLYNEYKRIDVIRRQCHYDHDPEPDGFPSVYEGALFSKKLVDQNIVHLCQMAGIDLSDEASRAMCIGAYATWIQDVRSDSVKFLRRLSSAIYLTLHLLPKSASECVPDHSTTCPA